MPNASRPIAAFITAVIVLHALCDGVFAQALSPRGDAASRRQEPKEGVRWATPRFVYKADGKRLSEVLMDFAASQNVAAVIADGVDGVVQASFDTTPNEFLSAVSKAYGIIWYFDGSAIYFYPSRSIQSRIFRLKGYTGAQVENLLRSLQLVDQRYPLRYNRAESTLLVYGPPRHVELVSAAVESLDVGATESHRAVTRVFPLRFAWAADRKFGDRSVPGVATLLRGLYRGEGADEEVPGVSGVRGATKSAAVLKRMYGMEEATPRIPKPQTSTADPSAVPERALTGNGPRGVRSPLDDDQDSPSFQADEATNAVIVHGRKDRMDEYADVIRRLDLKPTLVELEAMIIDVSNDSVDSLGIDWSAAGGKGSFSVTTPGSTPVQGNLNAATPGVFTISTLWQNAGRQLMARINALQADGKARVVAKPRVLGVANRPALMVEKRIANVRVAGNLDTSLYQVEAGTQLQVTPQVTQFDTANRIKLSIYILDGKFENQQVDNVPVIKRTEIQTEAYMTEGESLLIGGISVETDTSQNNGVPGISKLPVVGGLFRWKEARTARSERLFLITPRLVREQLPVAPVVPAAPAASAALPQG